MKIQIDKGMSLVAAIKEASYIARTARVSNVTFEFNGIELHVSPDSYAGDIARIYYLECDLRRLQR